MYDKNIGRKADNNLKIVYHNGHSLSNNAGKKHTLLNLFKYLIAVPVLSLMVGYSDFTLFKLEESR